MQGSISGGRSRWLVRTSVVGAAVVAVTGAGLLSDVPFVGSAPARASERKVVQPLPAPQPVRFTVIASGGGFGGNIGCSIVDYMYAACRPPKKMTHMTLWRLRSGMRVYGQHRPSDDNCSKSPDTPLPGVPFWQVCQMHDYAMQLIRDRYFTNVRNALQAADSAFYQALNKGVCAPLNRADPRSVACYLLARVYYTAVSRVHALTGRP
jgi:hypothetical protein